MRKFLGFILGVALGLTTVTYAQISGGGGGIAGGGGGGGGTPAAPATSIQFNNSGAFGGSANLVWNGTAVVTGAGQLATLADVSSAVSAASGAPTQGTFLVSGGQVVWTSNYTFLVSAASYYVNGTHYTSPQASVTLTAADATNDRLDYIVVNTSSVATNVTGTASSQPVSPDLDPSTQLALALILVTHNTTQPPATTSQLVYNENVGAATEWNWSSSGTGWALASTNNPYNGTKDIEATNVASGSYIQGAIGSGSDNVLSYSFLTFYIRSKGTWGTKTLQLRLQNSSGVVLGNTITIGQGSYGFDSTNTSSYQQIAIPTAQFGVSATAAVAQVRLTRAGSGNIGFYFDFMQWLGANGNQTSSNGTSLTFPGTLSIAANKTFTASNTLTLAGTDSTTMTFPSTSDTVVTLAATQTLTNKRITPRVATPADATSITPNTDSADMTYQANTQATGTLTINVDGGTPTNGQRWILKIKSTNVQTFSWSSSANGYLGGTAALPTATTGGTKVDYYSFLFDSISGKWHYVGTATGF